MDTPDLHAPDADRAARSAADSPVLEWGARAGFAVSGLLHVLIGWIALRVAWGGGGGSADQSGALATIAGTPGGAVLLWVVVVGFALLALWQLAQAATDAAGEDTDVTGLLTRLAQFVVYAALAWTSVKFATGAGSSSSSQTSDSTAAAMGYPGGRLLVGAVGLGVAAVGCYLIYRGWTSKFLEDLREHPGAAVVMAGRVGFVAKGFALAVLGFLFVVAAAQEQPEEAAGLDAALKSLREQPFGSVLLTVVALGLVAYGLYSFARARFAKT